MSDIDETPSGDKPNGAAAETSTASLTQPAPQLQHLACPACGTTMVVAPPGAGRAAQPGAPLMWLAIGLTVGPTVAVYTIGVFLIMAIASALWTVWEPLALLPFVIVTLFPIAGVVCAHLASRRGLSSTQRIVMFLVCYTVIVIVAASWVALGLYSSSFTDLGAFAD